jgi:hypothetical protein
MHDEPGRVAELADSIDERDGRAVSDPATEERPGLADDEVGRQHLLSPTQRRESIEGRTVSPVAGKRPRNPPTGVGELQAA